MNRPTIALTLFALALPALPPNAAAQAAAGSTPRAETLLGGRLANGGYGAPVERYSTVKGEPVLFSGAEGGWIINHRFILGGAAYGLATQNVRNAASPLRDSRNRAPVVEMGYGGVIFGYTQQPSRIVHLTVQALIGGGGVSYDVQDIAGVRMEDAPADGFFVAEPSIHAEVNVASFFRIALGGGYRLVSGAGLDQLGDADLRGASLSLSFKFGRF